MDDRGRVGGTTSASYRGIGADGSEVGYAVMYWGYDE